MRVHIQIEDRIQGINDDEFIYRDIFGNGDTQDEAIADAWECEDMENENYYSHRIMGFSN